MPVALARRANRVAPLVQCWQPSLRHQRQASDGARQQQDARTPVGQAPPCIGGPGLAAHCIQRPPLPRVISRPSVPHRTSAEIRAAFIDYFADEHGHDRVPPVPVIPANRDEGSYFINSGMMQFKPIFLGQTSPQSSLGRLRRATNSQRCARIGGKHNDLDDVGRDGTHLTLFEMLGSWSFGSYGRETACALAWEFLTRVLQLPPANLYVTYFGGDKELGLPADDYTRDVWLSLGVSDSRLMPFGKEHNFWEMAEHGPCGPCTEIHFDHIGGGRCARCFVNEDNPEVVEIWNLVFMEYERRIGTGAVRALPQRHIDTGMGLERMTSVVQGVTSAYDTDLFTGLLAGLHARSGLSRPYGGLFAAEPGQEGLLLQDVAYRIMADHLRLIVATVADGLLPARRGLGLKLRSVLHRTLRQGFERLQMPAGALADMAPVLTAALEPVRPGVGEHEEQIRQILLTEEENFRPRLQSYNVAFDQFLSDRTSADSGDGPASTELTADAVAKFMRSEGCTFDMLRVLALERGLTVALPGHLEDDEPELAEAEDAPLFRSPRRLARLLLSELGLPATRYDDVYDYSKNRKGKYEFPVQDGRVLALVGADGLLDSAQGGQECAAVLDSTSFYATGGGQECDLGLFTANLSRHHPQRLFEVTRVTQAGPYRVHEGVVVPGQELRTNQPVHLQINSDRRIGLMQHHTGTHVLNFCLRDLFGNGRVHQTSSQVLPDRLVFGFACVGPCDLEKLEMIEDHARQMVRANLPVHRFTRPAEEAVANSHIARLPGKGYPARVHVVSMGDGEPGLRRLMRKFPGGVPLDSSPMACAELCAGTHLHSTGDLVDLVVVSLRGAGVFNKEAVMLVGHAALEVRARGEELRQEAADLVRCMDAGAASDQWAARLAEIDRVMGRDLLPKTTRDRIALLLGPHRSRVATESRAEEKRRQEADAATAITDAIATSGDQAAVVVAMPIFNINKVVKLVHRLRPAKPVLLADAAGRRLVLYVAPGLPLSAADLAGRLCALANPGLPPDATPLTARPAQGKLAAHCALLLGGDAALLRPDRLLDLCARGLD